MDKLWRRTLFYSVVLIAMMLVYAVVYHVGMGMYEGGSSSFLHSLQVVVETFTTTGFGSDAPWRSPQMNLLVIVMDLTGVALIFLAFPVIIFPLLEDILSTTVPRTLDEDLDGHVVIAGYTSRVDSLIEELAARDVEYVLVEADRDRAVDLYEDDYRVLYGDPESVSDLGAAGLATARALVVDLADRIDTSIVLTAREVTESVPIVSLIEKPQHANYHRLAGADYVLSPRTLLGRSLVSKVTASLSAELDTNVHIGEDFEIAELPIYRGSDLVGTTLAESGIREGTGVNVIGAWKRGVFETPLSPDVELTNGTTLLVTGTERDLERLKKRTVSEMRPLQPGETIVVGYGQVGQTVVEYLEEYDHPCTVVDRDARRDADVVGDATDPETLREAGLERAKSVILAIPNDTTTEFATLVIREESPDTEIVARADESGNVTKLYRAGADYVASLATVGGRMTANVLMEDADVLSFEHQVKIVRTSAPALVGRTLEEERVRRRTGCTVVGIHRDGSVLTDVGPTTRIQQGDELVVAGPDEGIARFNDLFG
ncbi:MAG: TrkA family potassium uptake protein [Halanaeroarchaeum sp.]